MLIVRKDNIDDKDVIFIYPREFEIFEFIRTNGKERLLDWFCLNRYCLVVLNSQTTEPPQRCNLQEILVGCTMNYQEILDSSMMKFELIKISYKFQSYRT